jgi:hypothetical protein
MVGGSGVGDPLGRVHRFTLLLDLGEDHVLENMDHFSQCLNDCRHRSRCRGRGNSSNLNCLGEQRPAFFFFCHMGLGRLLPFGLLLSQELAPFLVFGGSFLLSLLDRSQMVGCLLDSHGIQIKESLN